MNKIRILTTDISNKIAAGEVVENPASVVKELIENAIDAGANLITVEIKNGGISYIRITDNGIGMEAEDAKAAFLRHATSKIASIDDLEKISTLGFRGEALASIAAVSNIELETKTKNGEGVFLRLEAGKLIDERATGCPDGTTITVNDLFFNTPARMKFLKTDRTETSYVTDIIQRLILGNPSVSIKYIVDGKERLFFGGDGSLRSCVYSVYGREYAKGALETERHENNVKILGLIGAADTSRGNRGFQSFFLNGRYIKNRPLTFAVEAAYKNVLMTGRFPFFVIHMDVSPEFADVNVHPSKQEVKFANERALCDEVYWAVKNTLAQGADEQIQKFAPIKTIGEKSLHFNEPITQIKMPDIKDVKTFISQIAQNSEQANEIDNDDYKIAGQLFDTYIIAEFKDKIVLIDQHAAHERLIFERLKKAYAEKQPMGQVLLSPISAILLPEEYAVVLENLKVFTDMGFEIEDFGNNSILIRQTPVNADRETIKALICELVDALNTAGEILFKIEEQMLKSISCKAAVKGNNMLHKSEIDALLSDMSSEKGINTCPHGRPLTVVMTKYELEKMFKRVV
ncbi:MAG: DNA mismatch repair endonuclease MutL [Firmicutes bacterium]|nr:DNA mismatch repair endonuclease MutL [Bacillota bacterium]